MKKIVSVLIVAIMLVSMVPGVSADATVKYVRYYADMSGPLSSTWLSNAFKTNSSDNFSSFRTNIGKVDDVTKSSGQALVAGTYMGKAASDQVMALGVAPGATGNYITSTGFLNPDNNNGDGTFVGYLEGEKAHLSAQVYIPTGLGYYSTNNPGPYTSLALCDGSSTTQVKPSTSTITGNGQVVTFKQTSATGGEIWFLGAQKTAQTWSSNTRYTVDTVVTFGANPTISVYVNGKPLSMPTGITADGTATTTENVKLSKATYGIMSNNMMGIATVSNPEGATVVYTDEWIFENLKANQEPELYNPLSIVGAEDGANINIETFAAIGVETDGVAMDKVTLYINEGKISELTAPPYVFNIPSTIQAGKNKIRVVGNAGSSTFTREITVNLIMMYNKPVMYEYFDNYSSQTDASNGGWYSPSTREWDIATGKGWFMTPAAVTDKNNVSFGKSFKMGAEAGADSHYATKADANAVNTQIKFGYYKINGVNGGTVAGGTVVLDYQQYLDNKNMGTLTLSGSLKLFEWDKDQQMIKWNVTPAVYSDPKVKEWENYQIQLDMTNSTPKMTVFIDEELLFGGYTMGSSTSKIDTLTWIFEPNEFTKGNFLALDEVKMLHIIERPRFKSITFHKGESTFTDADAAPADIDTIQITTEGTNLHEENFEKNISLLENGKELSYKVDGEVKTSEVFLKDNNIWIVPVRPLRSDAEYKVFLKSTAVFDDSKEPVGYDLEYPFTTAYKALDVLDITYYKNGVEVEDISTVTFAANDKLKAKITMCNANILDEDIVLLMMGYNGNRLTLPGIKPDKVPAEATGAVLETSEITITDPTNFSATATVWDGFGTLGIPAFGAHIGR